MKKKYGLKIMVVLELLFKRRLFHFQLCYVSRKENMKGVTSISFTQSYAKYAPESKLDSLSFPQSSFL